MDKKAYFKLMGLQKKSKIYSPGTAPARKGKIDHRTEWGQPLNGAAKYKDMQRSEQAGNRQLPATTSNGASQTVDPPTQWRAQLARSNPAAGLGQRNLDPTSFGTTNPPKNQKPGVVYFQDSRTGRWYPTTKSRILSLGFKFNQGTNIPNK